MSYEGIPSLENRYEINERGMVRNARTKKQLKYREALHQSEYVVLYVNGKQVRRTVADLLWEVHGIEPARRFPSAKTVYVRKGGEYYRFKSYRQCTDFLMERTSWKKTYIMRRLQRRQAEIEGWQIIYREAEERKPVTVRKANGDRELKWEAGLFQ